MALEFMRGKIILIFIVLITVLIGCNQSVSEIGSSLIPNTLFNIAFVDSMTLKVSTVQVDSLITSNTGRLLVGYHEDERLGPITVKSIFQLGINAPVSLDRRLTEYVSLKLYLKRDGYSYYDTTQAQTISIYQLSKGIKLFNGALYNKSRFSINKNLPPLATYTFLPRPHHSDSIEIALPDELGRQLMTLAQTSDFRVTTNDDFIKFFRGLAIIPDSTSSGNMIVFKVQPTLRLY